MKSGLNTMPLFLLNNLLKELSLSHRQQTSPKTYPKHFRFSNYREIEICDLLLFITIYKSSHIVVQLAIWLRQSRPTLGTKLGPESYREYAPDAAALERKYGIDQMHCTQLSCIIYRPRILKLSLVKKYFRILLWKYEKDKTLSNLALS